MKAFWEHVGLSSASVIIIMLWRAWAAAERSKQGVKHWFQMIVDLKTSKIIVWIPITSSFQFAGGRDTWRRQLQASAEYPSANLGSTTHCGRFTNYEVDVSCANC